MRCPKCNSEKKTKDGIVKQRQRYKCKECNFRFTVSVRSGTKPLHVKKLALQLYLEGLGFRSIGRILGVSNVNVLKWIRAFGEEVSGLQSSVPAVFSEMDEVHTYVGDKKTIDGYGLLLIDMGRNSSTSLLAIGVRKVANDSGGELKGE